MAVKTQAQQMVERYIDAEMAVLDGKAVQFGGRTLTMENLNQIREGRKEWERRAAAEGVRARGGNSRYSLAEMP